MECGSIYGTTREVWVEVYVSMIGLEWVPESSGVILIYRVLPVGR